VKPARTQYKTYVDARKIAEKAGKQIITVVTDAQHPGEIMERKSKVTQATVNAACDQLQTDSKNVTVNAVISAYDSKGTII
jgi:hypothetical protein